MNTTIPDHPSLTPRSEMEGVVAEIYDSIPDPSPESDSDDEYVTIASFDVGKKNISHYVERYNRTYLLTLKEFMDSGLGCLYATPSPRLKNTGGRKKMVYDVHNLSLTRTSTHKTKLSKADTRAIYKEFILTKIFLSSERVHTGVYDIGIFDTQGAYDADSSDLSKKNVCDWKGLKYDAAEVKHGSMEEDLLDYLEKFKWLWSRCTEVIIEKQFYSVTEGKRPNLKAIQIAQALKMWFHSYSRHRVFSEQEDGIPVITYVPSTYKTYTLGTKKKMNKAQRKEWTTIHSRGIYALRGDTSLESIFTFKEYLKGKRLNTYQFTIAKYKWYIENNLETSPGKIEKLRELGWSDRVEDCTISSEVTNDMSVLEDDALRLSLQVCFDRQKLDDISDSLCQLQAWKYKKYIDL